MIADESIIGSRDAVGFVLRLGRALHAYGIPAHRLEEVMEKASERLGRRLRSSPPSDRRKNSKLF
jgi:uncharacterized membrane protein YjjP (DUF1212 family)